MNLKNINSQKRAINQLQRAFAAGKTAHAYIFSGPDGVGKRTTARAFAKMLLCHNRKQINGFYDSCGQCPACKLFDSQGHPDYKPIYKELIKFTESGKNKTTPVDMPKAVIDEMIIEKVSKKPTESNYVIYVIDEAEKVNKSSQNALLKILEEPPSYCVIILLCSKLQQMLPTTLSRCHLVRFQSLDESFVVDKLIENGIDQKQAQYWSRFSEGSVGKALSWAGLQLGDKNPSVYEQKCQWIQTIAQLSLSQAIEVSSWASQASKTVSAAWSAENPELSTTDLNRRAQKGFIQMVIALLADVINLHCGNNKRLINQDQLPLVKQVAGKIQAYEASTMILKIQSLNNWIDASVNEKLIFEQLAFILTGCVSSNPDTESLTG